MSLLINIRPRLEVLKQWVAEHDREILLAILFAVLVGWPFARVVGPPDPNLYKIYVITASPANTDTSEPDPLEAMASDFNANSPKIDDVPIQIKIERLASSNDGGAKEKAEELIQRADTLLVIGSLNSQLTEVSLPLYLRAQPSAPFIAAGASDDDLLAKCDQESDCTTDGSFVPLLQLSPTNAEQGDAAVRYALQKDKKRFLIVQEDDQGNEAYSKSLVRAYHDAIDHYSEPYGAVQVGAHVMGPPPSTVQFAQWDPQCVLYAGRPGAALTLLNAISSQLSGEQRRKILVILSDSSVQPAALLSNKDAFAQAQVLFTYQIDAEDYDQHTNAFNRDAVAVATQLIEDFDKRGGDFWFRTKSFFHLQTARDARRSLVGVMEQNQTSRTWYQGVSNSAYIFQGHRRFGGMFHVWMLHPDGKWQDVDGWHPPRALAPRPPGVLAFQTSTVAASP